MDRIDRFETLVAILDRLREPGGCPWDREQTYRSLRGYVLEECYEAVDALDREDLPDLREELGDLLLQIVFLARLAKEDGAFTAADVVAGISEKMIRRHPHVFGDAEAENAEQVLRQWEEIKKEEKKKHAAGGNGDGGARPSVLDGLPAALPALLRAQRLGTKAARVGFDWAREADVLDKVDEEVRELRQAVESNDAEHAREEFGDLLFSLVMLGRKMGIDADDALAHANRKFEARFRAMEDALHARGLTPEKAGLETMDRVWNEVKGG